MRLPRLLNVVVAVASASAVFVPTLAVAADAPGVRSDGVQSPNVAGPIPGQPTSLSAVDLAAHDYVEEEFFIEGMARATSPPRRSQKTGGGT